MRFYRGLQPFKVMSFDLDDTLYDNSDVIRLAEERFLQCVQEQAQLSDFTQNIGENGNGNWRRKIP